MKTEVGQKWVRNKRSDKWKMAIEIIPGGDIATITDNGPAHVNFVLDALPNCIWPNVPKDVFFIYFDLLEPIEEA